MAVHWMFDDRTGHQASAIIEVCGEDDFRVRKLRARPAHLHVCSHGDLGILSGLLRDIRRPLRRHRQDSYQSQGDAYNDQPRFHNAIAYFLSETSSSTRQSLIAPVFSRVPVATANVLASGEKVTAETDSFSLGNTRFGSQEAVSHRMTSLLLLPSSTTAPPVARSLPSGEKATAHT